MTILAGLLRRLLERAEPRICAASASNGTIIRGFSAVWRGDNSRVEAGLKVIKRSK